MDLPPRVLPPKKEVLTSFLEDNSARVFLDPRREGVVVPKFLAKQAELVLRLGHKLRPPIPDLEISDDGVRCTLSFNRAPFLCSWPWSAVYAVISDDGEGRGVVWPDDVPVESQLVTSHRPRPRLAGVREVSDAPPAPESEQGAAPPRARPELALRPEPPRRADAALRPQPALARRDERTDTAKTGTGASKKPKRPLPPYLRVVK